MRNVAGLEIVQTELGPKNLSNEPINEDLLTIELLGDAHVNVSHELQLKLQYGYHHIGCSCRLMSSCMASCRSWSPG